MRTYWSHAAMLLLGVTLTAVFYEGRELVRNTASALTAASSIAGGGSAQPHRGRARAHDGRDEPIEPGAARDPADAAAAATAAELERKRRLRRAVPGGLEPTATGAPIDKLNALRLRQRQRLMAGKPGVGPTATLRADTKDLGFDPAADPVDPGVDTGLLPGEDPDAGRPRAPSPQ